MFLGLRAFRAYGFWGLGFLGVCRFRVLGLGLPGSLDFKVFSF